MITVTDHGRKRIRERCGVNLKSADRLASIAYNNGIDREETTGALRKHLDDLYDYNMQANNIKLHGDKIYIFCNDVLITVLDIPSKHMKTLRRIQEKRGE